MKVEEVKTKMDTAFMFFTEEWKFNLVKSAIQQYGPVLIFEKAGRHIELRYDMREKAFYFKLTKAISPGEDWSPVYIINALLKAGITIDSKHLNPADITAVSEALNFWAAVFINLGPDFLLALHN